MTIWLAYIDFIKATIQTSKPSRSCRSPQRDNWVSAIPHIDADHVVWQLCWLDDEEYNIDLKSCGPMILDALIKIKDEAMVLRLTLICMKSLWSSYEPMKRPEETWRDILSRSTRHWLSEGLSLQKGRNLCGKVTAWLNDVGCFVYSTYSTTCYLPCPADPAVRESAALVSGTKNWLQPFSCVQTPLEIDHSDLGPDDSWYCRLDNVTYCLMLSAWSECWRTCNCSCVNWLSIEAMNINGKNGLACLLYIEPSA